MDFIYEFGNSIADITINLAPADLRKEGSSFDLPLAIGLLGANNNKIGRAHV